MPDNPADFQEWVRCCRNDLEKRFPYFDEASFESGTCSHYPRAIMGAYLKERFQGACQSARAMGLIVDLYPQTEVVDLMESSGKIHLTVKNCRWCHDKRADNRCQHGPRYRSLNRNHCQKFVS